MIDDWRYSTEKMEDRQYTLACLIRNKVVIKRSAYEFCADFISQGRMDYAHSQCEQHEFSCLDAIIMKEYYEWVEQNEETEPELTPMEGVDMVG